RGRDFCGPKLCKGGSTRGGGLVIGALLHTAERIIFFNVKAHGYWAFFTRRLRRRTPGPPPSSSMKSTPAASRVRRTAKSLAAVIDVSFSESSARRIVATLSSDSRARSSALHRRRARAALI